MKITTLRLITGLLLLAAILFVSDFNAVVVGQDTTPEATSQVNASTPEVLVRRLELAIEATDAEYLPQLVSDIRAMPGIEIAYALMHIGVIRATLCTRSVDEIVNTPAQIQSLPGVSGVTQFFLDETNTPCMLPVLTPAQPPVTLEQPVQPVDPVSSIIALSLLLFAIVAPVALITRGIYKQFRSDVKEVRERVDQAQSEANKESQKVKPAWDLARVTLESYFVRNLSQISYIFWLSVLVMTVGFVIIVFGIIQSIQSASSPAPAIIATVAGILTEFIGATFLFIYRSTVEQASSYTDTLERINAVGMAMQILDSMPDDATDENLKNRVKAKLVELLIQQARETPPEQKE